MVLGESGRNGDAMVDFLVRDNLSLPIYARCLLGLELHRTKENGRRDEVMATISQFMKRDEENQTNYLDLKNDGYWWFWYGGDVEAHSWYLKLLSAVKPQAVETRGLVKYLVNNRKHASYWNSTRDTAFAIEAIAAYLKASGELAPEMEVEVLLDGKSLRKIAINRDNLFAFDGTIGVDAGALATGKHEIELKRTGKGALYANAYLEVFSLEDFLPKAGLEVNAKAIERAVGFEARKVVIKNGLVGGRLDLHECAFPGYRVFERKIDVGLQPAQIRHSAPAAARKDQVGHQLEI